VRDSSGNSKFVNVARFIEEQTQLLDSVNPPVDKKVLIGQNYEQQTLKDINWKRELEMFMQADISKPAVQAGYELEEQNKIVRIYKPKSGENPDIEYLKISFDEQGQQIQTIEAHISQWNYLYKSEKKISLQCKQNAAGKTQITAYQIKGFQKLLFNEEVPFEIEARVL